MVTWCTCAKACSELSGIFTMNTASFLAALRSRAGLALGVLLLTVAATLGASLLLPRTYVATATVIIDQGRPDPMSMSTGWQPPVMAALSTQMDIIRSERVAAEVVRRLSLTTDPALRQAWNEGRSSVPTVSDLGGSNVARPAAPSVVPQAWLVERLLAALEVKPARDSDVLSISVRWSTPEQAAALANAFVQAYLETSVSLRADQARRYAGFFENRAREARLQLEQAQARLSTFQRARGVVVGDERLDVETSRLNELSSQFTLLQAVVAESGSRQVQSQGAGADRMQEVLSHPALMTMRADLTRAEARVQELNDRLGDNHPQVLEARGQVGLLKARLESETRRVAGGAAVSNTINRQRESDMRSSLEVQRQRVMNMKAVRDEALVLARDVDNAQRAHDGLLTRLQQTSLEGQATQGQAHLLSSAPVPVTVAAPGWTVRAGLALVLGLLLALGAVAMVERVDARARLPASTAQWLGVPLLGVLPGPKERGSFAPNKAALVQPWRMGQLPAPTTPSKE
jgi:chain length determinant protein EpsF